MKIPYEDLSKVNQPYVAQMKREFSAFLEKGHFVLGGQVELFEREFAQFCGARYATGVANGLEAISIALRSLGFPKGSEVLVASNAYIACVLGIVHAGLTPVLVEPDLLTYNISAQGIEALIGPKTKAILAVHMYGKSCPMGDVLQLANKHGLRVVEDCAQAHGATFLGRTVGSFGDFAAFSFYPTKNLGALGDAGAIVSSDETLIRRAAKLRNYGRVNRDENDVLGFNSRLDELQAAFLRIKLKELEAYTRRKREIAEFYFSNLPTELVLPNRDERFGDVFHVFSIRHPARENIRQHLAGLGIGTLVHYPIPPHRQKAFLGFDFFEGSFPIADEIHNTILSIPSSVYLKDSEVEEVVAGIKSFF